MPKWHFKLAVSSFVKRNMKSGGKRSIFLLTCRFICARSTWYNMAKSLSIITCCPLTVMILASMASSPLAVKTTFSDIFCRISLLLHTSNNKASQARYSPTRFVDSECYGIQICSNANITIFFCFHAHIKLDRKIQLKSRTRCPAGPSVSD